MLQYRKKTIDKLIRRTIFEMVLVIFATVGSYFIFTESNLSASASVAQEFATGENALQVMVGKNESEGVREKNLVDKTLLTVRNPNKKDKYVDINLVILNPSNINVNNLYVVFNGNTIDLSNGLIEGNTYKVKIHSGLIGAYENLQEEVLIYSNEFTDTFSYTFSVNESYYQ